MSARRTERLLNLVICLLHTRRYLSAEQVRATVAGYADLSDEAFKRKFERDKEDLRELGIPLETGSDSVFDDEVGYRIRRDDYALPEVALAPDEAAVIAVAARAWSRASLGAAASGALLKLQAAGLDTGESVPLAIETRVRTAEPAFEPLRAAVASRTPVTFDYRVVGAGRTLEPWGLVSWHGHWYVVGHDRGRSATRVFRLSRVVGAVAADGPPGSFDVPADVDLRQAVVGTVAEPPTATARIRTKVGAAYGLRRRATSVAPDIDGWDVLTVDYADPYRLAHEVLSFGSDVVLIDPPDARAIVVDKLRAVLA